MRVFALVFACVVAIFVVATAMSVEPFAQMNVKRESVQNVQVVDRNNIPLSVSYQNRWNIYDLVELHRVPELLKQAFVLSEDKNFYEHGGVDWMARLSALWNIVRFQRSSRGASTLSEQVVRMHHPRPRTLWSKWLETVEVMQLEARYNKAEIFEFYLNQLPYVSNRRGVVQGARHYFSRDLSTLSVKEMLALVVLARAPSRYDLYKNPSGIESAIMRLARRLGEVKALDEATVARVETETLVLSSAPEPVNASHFVTYVRSQVGDADTQTLHTTLDSMLQARVQALLDKRVKSLQPFNLNNGGAIVLDHQSGEILAWVVAGAKGDESLQVPGHQIDTVTTLRQPGSSLKPFLYALALDLGYSDETIIEDAPLAQMIGEGYHRFANYSHRFYGPVTLRQALGNSLNIPALRTIQFAGVGRYLDKLHALGFENLKESREFYEEGLALGTGEVTILEIAQAYAALAERGNFRQARFLMSTTPTVVRPVFSEESASLIGDILSDAKARHFEFGANSVQNLPVQTAVKTGTSSDYHDSWAVGYNYRYVVAVWMGNLDREPTQGVTGATGPALTMRSIFGELTRNAITEPLYKSPRLAQKEPIEVKPDVPAKYKLVVPTSDMQIAIDPRVDRDKQQLIMRLNKLKGGDRVVWTIDGKIIATTTTPMLAWRLHSGTHMVSVSIQGKDKVEMRLPSVKFVVK